MRDLDIALEKAGVDERLSKFVAGADGELGACRKGGEWAICIGRTLPLGRLLSRAGGGSRNGGVFGDISGRELDLGFLLESGIGGEEVGREGVDQILPVLLGDRRRKRREDGKDGVGYGERELSGLWERLRETYTIELRGAREMFRRMINWQLAMLSG